MVKQKSKTELIAEIESLLERYEQEEMAHDDPRRSSSRAEFRQANAVWLIGDGPVATALKKHLRPKQLTAFWSKYFSVSEERFIGWIDCTKPYRSSYFANPQCSKILPRVDRRCKGKTKRLADIPNLFFLGVTDRCNRHVRDMTEEEWIEWTMYMLECDRQKAKELRSMSREEMSDHIVSNIVGPVSTGS
jgi:hypothetical protein